LQRHDYHLFHPQSPNKHFLAFWLKRLSFEPNPNNI
jgi:hypothetical protein